MVAQTTAHTTLPQSSTLGKSSFTKSSKALSSLPRRSRSSSSARAPVQAAQNGLWSLFKTDGKAGSLVKEEYAAEAYLTGRAKVVNESFGGALGIDDFISRVEVALYAFGFSGDNSIAMVNLCRDEITAILKQKIENVFGSGFNTNGLGGVLTCGATGLKAGFSHSPICSGTGKERYVFFSFPHIAVDATGKVGAISRPGRPGESCACGALAASLAEIKANGITNSCKIPGVHDPLDPELSILKQRLARRLRYEGTSEADMKAMDLVAITKLAERTISDDLEYLISKAVDPAKADYAVITGVQVHNWGPEYDGPSPTLEFVWPTNAYVVVDGVKTYLDISAVPTLTPRQINLLASNSAPASDLVCENGGVGTIREVEISWANAQSEAASKEKATAFRTLLLEEGLEPVLAADPAWKAGLVADAPKEAGAGSTKLDAETFTNFSEEDSVKYINEELNKFVTNVTK